MNALSFLLLLPVLGGSIFYLASLATVVVFFRRDDNDAGTHEKQLPPVSILKPVYGLERNLERNLRSACEQDYPGYQVVLSVQRLDDPALPLLRRLEQAYGSDRVTVAVRESEPVVNGKVQNLQIGLAAATHDVLVISDSDVYMPPGYLRRITAPLHDPEIGYVCTLYRAVDADKWHERLELLTYNADFIPCSLFAYVTGASDLCLGASVALHRSTLESIGGLESLAEYLVEDYELGRRIVADGRKMKLLPYFVELTVDLDSPSAWWRHQIYWDQNTRAAQPAGFVASVMIRAVPFALLFAILRAFDPLGLTVLAGALAIRLGTAAGIAAVFRDRAGLRALWLLPLRDVAGLVSWGIAIGKRRFVWRGHEFELTRDGRILPRTP